MGRAGLRAVDFFVHDLEEVWQIAKDIHLPRRLFTALRYHHHLVLVHLQHGPQAARETQQVRLDAGEQEQAEVLPEQERSQADRDDAGHLPLLHHVLPATDGGECVRGEDEVPVGACHGLGVGLELGGHQPDHLRRRQLAVSQRLQESLRANQDVEKLEQLRQQQQSSGVAIQHRRSELDNQCDHEDAGRGPEAQLELLGGNLRQLMHEIIVKIIYNN